MQEQKNQTSKIRKALAALAVATAIATPVAVAGAAPAQAENNCPIWMCGSNHNEDAATDDGQ